MHPVLEAVRPATNQPDTKVEPLLEDGIEQEKKIAIIKLGGSEVIGPDGVKLDYLRELLDEIWNSLENYDQVVFVVGGGNRAREVQEKFRDENPGMVKKDLYSSLDIVGMETTREHADQIIAFLGEYLKEKNSSHLKVNQNVPTSEQQAKDLLDTSNKFIVLGGLEIGQTTDAVAAYMAAEAQKKYEDDPVKLLLALIVLSNVDAIYDKHPDEDGAKKILRAFLPALVEAEILLAGFENYKPGMHIPIDPIAVLKYIEVLDKEAIELLFANGKNIYDIVAYLNGDLEKVKDGTRLYGRGKKQRGDKDIESEESKDHSVGVGD